MSVDRLSQLPPELLIAIFSRLLGGNHRSPISSECALLSKALLDPVRMVIYDSVVLEHPLSFTRLCRTVEENEGFGRLIRRLDFGEVSPGNRGGKGNKAVARLMKALPNLEWIVLGSPASTKAFLALIPPASFSRVKKLRLVGAKTHDLLNISRLYPQLTHVTLIDVIDAPLINAVRLATRPPHSLSHLSFYGAPTPGLRQFFSTVTFSCVSLTVEKGEIDLVDLLGALNPSSLHTLSLTDRSKYPPTNDPRQRLDQVLAQFDQLTSLSLTNVKLGLNFLFPVAYCPGPRSGLMHQIIYPRSLWGLKRITIGDADYRIKEFWTRPDEQEIDEFSFTTLKEAVGLVVVARWQEGVIIGGPAIKRLNQVAEGWRRTIADRMGEDYYADADEDMYGQY